MGDEAPAVLASEIEILSGQGLEENPVDLNESSDEEEEDAKQAASAPITPPVVLIDTSPLNPPVDIVDPVSGSGNPAALGSGPIATSGGDDQ